jgi:hypothetical protein
LQAIDAAKAGKDIYCEKPISITVQQGRQLAETVRRYGRIFQTGTQYRSIPTIRQVCDFVRRGGLGKVKQVFTLWTSLGGFFGAPRFAPYRHLMDVENSGKSYAPLSITLPAEPVPDGLDWELWVGPALWRPYNPAYHLNPSPGVVPWAFCEDFGAASVTWHHSHSADVIQYALGAESSGPVELIHPGSGAYPTLTCKYANGTLLHLVDHWGMVKDLYEAVPATARLAGNFGGVFVGERGWVTSMSTGGRRNEAENPAGEHRGEQPSRELARMHSDAAPAELRRGDWSSLGLVGTSDNYRPHVATVPEVGPGCRGIPRRRYSEPLALPRDACALAHLMRRHTFGQLGGMVVRIFVRPLL